VAKNEAKTVLTVEARLSGKIAALLLTGKQLCGTWFVWPKRRQAILPCFGGNLFSLYHRAALFELDVILCLEQDAKKQTRSLDLQCNFDDIN